jgi:hypothetical protein
MVAPLERNVSIKTDRRDAERIVMEDMLNYLRRCYIPSQYIKNIRFVVTQQIRIGRRIARVKNQVHALLEMNMIQHELEDMADIFGVKGLKKLSKIQLRLRILCFVCFIDFFLLLFHSMLLRLDLHFLTGVCIQLLLFATIQRKFFRFLSLIHLSVSY